MIVAHKVIIIRTHKLKEGSLNDEIKWLCQSLGLFSLRDKDSSCYRIFIELLKSTKTNKLISSDEMAYSLRLSRGTVIHHINRLIDSGLVESEKSRYRLRVKNLEILIRELQKDMERTFQDLKETAKKIDRELEF